MSLPPTQSLRGVTFGDLHLLAGRQASFRSRDWFEHWREDFDLCVLNGDIFDFRWARRHRGTDALQEARAWLEQLLRPPVRSRFVLIMGNHDATAAYRSLLDGLRGRYEHMRWAEHWVRLGDKVFFHGDFPDESGEVDRLRAERERFGGLRLPGRGRRGLYWVVSQVGLTGAVPRALPWRRYCARSDYFLSREIGEAYSGVRDVYLGHTHVHFRDLEIQARRFHNSGTPLRGGQFRPIPFTFSASEWEALEHG
jgi:hypothetical protein